MSILNGTTPKTKKQAAKLEQNYTISFGFPESASATADICYVPSLDKIVLVKQLYVEDMIKITDIDASVRTRAYIPTQQYLVLMDKQNTGFTIGKQDLKRVLRDGGLVKLGSY